ncbi:TPA: hypothetical protein ACLIVI_005422 [Bacillus pacificus]
MERLFYEPKIMEFERQMRVAAHERNLIYNPNYLHYHNYICPRCRGEMVIKNKTIRNVEIVFVGIIETLGYVYPYVICKQCEVKSRAETKEQEKITVEQTENYIFETLSNMDESK